MRELELLVHALERFLRAQPLADVVDDHQPRLAAAPAHQVRDAVDVERAAVLVLMAKDAAVGGPRGDEARSWRAQWYRWHASCEDGGHGSGRSRLRDGRGGARRRFAL